MVSLWGVYEALSIRTRVLGRKRLIAVGLAHERNTMKIQTMENSKIVFDNGYTLADHHSQDCCENVYADFDHLKVYNVLPHTGEKITIFDIEFDEDIDEKIVGQEGEGFCLVAKDESKWFVPCYNSQNGYYSSQLGLVIQKGETTKEIDITDFVKDQIS